MLRFEKFEFVMWQIILLGLLLISTYSSAECNVCQPNQAACINSTSFYLCFGNREPSRLRMYHCQKGFECTNLTAICVQTSSQRRPSCGDTSLCSMCSANRNFKFACHSRNTFQMCYGAIRPTGPIGYCPPGYVCYGGSENVCVLEDTINSVTCDIVDGVEMATSSPLTPSPTTTSTEKSNTEMVTPTKTCEQHRLIGLYPTLPNDPYCKRYIYCYYSNGVMRGRDYNCSSGTYFHIQQKKCVFNKPTYCL